MEWLLGAVIIILIAGFLVHRSEQRKNGIFSQEFSRNYQRFFNLIQTGNIEIPNPEADGYCPVRGEIVFAFSNILKDHDRKTEGRLVVTNKAVIFESASRSERLVYSSLSSVEAKIDGIEIRKRNGPRRAFRTSDPEILGLIVAAFNGSRTT